MNKVFNKEIYNFLCNWHLSTRCRYGMYIFHNTEKETETVSLVRKKYFSSNDIDRPHRSL